VWQIIYVGRPERADESAGNADSGRPGAKVMRVSESVACNVWEEWTTLTPLFYPLHERKEEI
jgi:hypothetical protein